MTAHALAHLALDHWLFHPLVGRGYQFWSGIAGCLGILGVLWAYVRRHNCHVRWCPRPAWHEHPQHGHPVCKRHHPHDPSRLGDYRAR